jgi:hypothetical protein
MPALGTYPADTLDDTDKILGSTSGGLAKNFAGTEFGKLNVEDQILAGGARVTTKVLATGSVTIDPGDRPLQAISNNGAFTITAPANDGSCMLLVANDSAAGAITFSGFTVGSNTGDALTNNAGHKFTISIWRISGIAGYRIAAHQ